MSSSFLLYEQGVPLLISIAIPVKIAKDETIDETLTNKVMRGILLASFRFSCRGSGFRILLILITYLHNPEYKTAHFSDRVQHSLNTTTNVSKKFPSPSGRKFVSFFPWGRTTVQLTRRTEPWRLIITRSRWPKNANVRSVAIHQ